MATLGIIHGNGQNEPRNGLFILTRADYEAIVDLGEFNNIRYVNSDQIIEEGRRLYYIGGKPAGEILTPGQYIHGHLNFGTTYRTLTYLCTDHANTVQQLYNQIPNQTPLQLWGNPNMTPWKTPTAQGGNGNEVPHPIYEPHNVASDIAGAPPSWGTFSVELLFKYEADDYTGKMDPLCSNGDNYIVYCPTGDHQRNVRCFGFYGSKDPFPMLNY